MFSDIFEFRSDMMNYFLQYLPETETYELSERDREEAESLADSKYKTWEWNWAYGPEYQFINRFEAAIFCRLFVRDGIIRECLVEGTLEQSAAGLKLIGCRHMVSDILRVFEKENVFIDEKQIFNFF